MTRSDQLASELLERVGVRLAGHPTRQVSMFGTIALMVDGSILVGVNKDGSLLVRVHPDDDAGLIRVPDASRPEMGGGRSMGVGWIRVDAAAIRDDATLDLWLRHALSRAARKA